MSFPSCHRKRWNITIVVLLLMVASGLLALLTLQFVKHFLTSGSLLDDYYKAYYMARGWLETLLTEANSRGYGFQHDLSQTTIQTNYYNNCTASWLCKLQGGITSQWRSVSASVESLTSACSADHMISLAPWASSAYPLFYDRWMGDNISFAPVQTADYEKLWVHGFEVSLDGGALDAYLYDAGQGSFGQITASEHLTPPSVSHLFSQQPLVYTHWLIITNPNTANSAVSYCLQSDDAAQLLVGNFTNINSQATYRDKTVGVTAIKKFVFPSAFIQ